jgi:hypothetical protein
VEVIANGGTTANVTITRRKIVLNLDTALTDAAQAAHETQADSVNRVKIFLQNKGYVFP